MSDIDNSLKNKIIKKLEYSLLFIPMLAVYLPTILYPVTNEVGSNISFRPPGYVFAIVWPILLILLGINWFNRRKISKFLNSIYVLLIFLLSIWFILYDNNKIFGLIDIILSFFVVLFIFIYKFKSVKYYIQLMLVPLMVWLIFASILNIAALYS
jgi:tryptophan-rich sensory protein